MENAVGSVAGVGQVTVKLTFDPPWDKDRMSDEARLLLGMFLRLSSRDPRQRNIREPELRR